MMERQREVLKHSSGYSLGRKYEPEEYFCSIPVLVDDKRLLLELAKKYQIPVNEVLHEIISDYVSREHIVIVRHEPEKLPELMVWMNYMFGPASEIKK
jgi:hypothetical protein